MPAGHAVRDGGTKFAWLTDCSVDGSQRHPFGVDMEDSGRGGSSQMRPCLSAPASLSGLAYQSGYHLVLSHG